MNKLFIGIDFSKKSFDVCFFSSSDLSMMYHHSFTNDACGWSSLIDCLGRESSIDSSLWIFCGEHTGLYSLGLAHYLIRRGYLLSLENPTQIKLCCGIRREKSDRADARQIALYAYRFEDKLRPFVLMDDELSSLALLLCFRERLVKNKCCLLVSCVEIRSVLKTDSTAGYIYQKSMQEVERINKEIKEIEKRMLKIIAGAQSLKENYDLVTSVKGIGLICAASILIYTANFTRFEDPRKFACYAGVVPFEKSSGTSLNKGRHISRMANIKLKTLLTQGARSAVVHDKELREYYNRKKKEGKMEKVVINNVRNKLVHRVFAVVNKREKYKELTPTPVLQTA